MVTKALFVSLVWVLMGASFAVHAQDFSGTMTWSARIEILDAQTASQVNLVQDALKNPELFAMLAKSPQLRGFLEDKLGPLNTTNGATQLLPTGFTLQIKGPRALLKTEGGVVSREVLALGDKAAVYSLNRPARTFERLSSDAAATIKIRVTRTTETAVILGYTCRRFIVETDDLGEKSRSSVWTTNGIKGLNAATFKRLNLGQVAGAGFVDQIDGVPLKIDAVTPDAKIALLATRITPGALDAALFNVPTGFREVAGSAK